MVLARDVVLGVGGHLTDAVLLQLGLHVLHLHTHTDSSEPADVSDDDNDNNNENENDNHVYHNSSSSGFLAKRHHCARRTLAVLACPLQLMSLCRLCYFKRCKSSRLGSHTPL